MRNISRLFVGLLAFVLVSCAVPGGIYKGYEGPEIDVTGLAVLDWTTTESKITHIDGKKVQERSPLLTGIEITIAHLPPGPHSITIKHKWKEIYYGNWSSETLDLRADLRPGQTYEIHELPRYDLDPFQVKFSLVEVETGTTVQEGTVVGSDSYWEVRQRELRKCVQSCDKWCGSDYDDEEYWECIEEEDDCEDDCECEWGDGECRPFWW